MMIKSLSLIAALHITPISSCHYYTRWHYPWKQQCRPDGTMEPTIPSHVATLEEAAKLNVDLDNEARIKAIQNLKEKLEKDLQDLEDKVKELEKKTKGEGERK